MGQTDPVLNLIRSMDLGKFKSKLGMVDRSNMTAFKIFLVSDRTFQNIDCVQNVNSIKQTPANQVNVITR